MIMLKARLRERRASSRTATILCRRWNSDASSPALCAPLSSLRSPRRVAGEMNRLTSPGIRPHPYPRLKSSDRTP
jgi:hypothetical protein